MTETKERGGKERSFDRSEFGKCLNDLMFSRDIFTATDLSAAMKENGDDIPDRLIRQLWSRKSRPSHDVMDAIARALKLNLREKSRLTMSIYYGEEWREI